MTTSRSKGAYIIEGSSGYELGSSKVRSDILDKYGIDILNEVVEVVKREEMMSKETIEKKLTKQLEDIQKKSRPNLNPAFKAKKEKKVDPLPPQLEEYQLAPEVKGRIKDLIARHAEISSQEAGLKSEKDDITFLLKNLCKDNGLRKFMVGDIQGDYYNQVRSTIAVESLLAHGVSPQVIAACTEEKEVWSFRAKRRVNNGTGSEQED